MMTQSRLTPLLLAGCLGLGALTLIPAHETAGVAAATTAPPVVSATIGPPDPLLIRTLDEAVKPAHAPDPEMAPDPGMASAAAPSAIPAVAEIQPPEASSEPPQPSFSATGRIGGSAVNYRSGPSSSAGRIGVLQAGEPVNVIETSNGWVHVATVDGRDGWIYGRFLDGAADAPEVATSDPKPSPVKVSKQTDPGARAVVRGNKSGAPLTNRTARVASVIPARANPRDGSPSVFTLRPGQRVLILGVRGQWMQVATADGETGWVRRSN